MRGPSWMLKNDEEAPIAEGDGEDDAPVTDDSDGRGPAWKRTRFLDEGHVVVEDGDFLLKQLRQQQQEFEYEEQARGEEEEDGGSYYGNEQAGKQSGTQKRSRPPQCVFHRLARAICVNQSCPAFLTLGPWKSGDKKQFKALYNGLGLMPIMYYDGDRFQPVPKEDFAERLEALIQGSGTSRSQFKRFQKERKAVEKKNGNNKHLFDQFPTPSPPPPQWITPSSQKPTLSKITVRKPAVAAVVAPSSTAPTPSAPQVFDPKAAALDCDLYLVDYANGALKLLEQMVLKRSRTAPWEEQEKWLEELEGMQKQMQSFKKVYSEHFGEGQNGCASGNEPTE